MRPLKVAVWLLAILVILDVALAFVTIPTGTLWPLRMVAREILPLFVVVNIAGAVSAFFSRRILLPIFVIGFAVSLWPLALSIGVGQRVDEQWRAQGFSASSLNFPGPAAIYAAARPLNVPPIEPEVLTPVIHLYKLPSVDPTRLLPIVIDIHGGSWQNGSVRDDETAARLMAGRQYAVFAIDYRKAPVDRFPAQIDDVRTAIAWIHQNAAGHGGDPQRIALLGRSAGGHLALLAGYTNRDVPIRAVVSLYGPTDITAGYEDPPVPDPIRIREKLEALTGGTPQTLPDLYRAASPATYVHAGLPPTLLIQGGSDHIVKPRFPRELSDRLIAQGSRSLLLELPWADHSFDFVYFGPGNVIAQAVIDRFLEATLRH